MKKINCPFCNNPVEINIAKAVDEEGETFMCPKCKKVFRFVQNN